MDSGRVNASGRWFVDIICAKNEDNGFSVWLTYSCLPSGERGAKACCLGDWDEVGGARCF